MPSTPSRDRVALIFGDRQVTYAELDDEANRLAHHLAARGVGRGDHVGLYARNSIEAVETLLATSSSGPLRININYRYLRDELAYHLRDADLSALVYDQDLRSGRRTPSCPPDCPAWRSARTSAEAAVVRQARWRPRRPSRDFAPRSTDDVYIIYTGGHHRASRRASCGATRTSGARSAAASTSSPASRWQTSGRSPARAPRAAAWSAWLPLPLIHGAAQVAHAGLPVRRGHGRARCRSSTRTRSGARSSGTRSTC